MDEGSRRKSELYGRAATCSRRRRDALHTRCRRAPATTLDRMLFALTLHRAPGRVCSLAVAGLRCCCRAPAEAQWKWRDAAARSTSATSRRRATFPTRTCCSGPKSRVRKPAAAPAAAASAPAAAAALAKPPVDPELEERRKRTEQEQAAARRRPTKQKAAAVRKRQLPARPRAAGHAGQRPAHRAHQGRRRARDPRRRARAPRRCARAREVIASECR